MRQEEWWRNVRDAAEVDLLLAGVQVQDSAVVLEGAQHSDKVSEGLAAYVRAMPERVAHLGCPRANVQQLPRTPTYDGSVGTSCWYV
jgi:hypothetical protein